MRRHIFIIFLLFLLLFPSSKILAHVVRNTVPDESQNYFCTLYFTYIGCPNCAVCDPIVLTEWPKKYPNLVVIEYGWHGGDWEDPNSQFFGEYAKAYKTQPAVPQIIIDKKNIRLGRIDVPKAESYIKMKKFNPCPLIDKSISFEELDLTKLPAFPKIWANGRILIKLSENEYLFQWNGENPPRTIGKEKITQKELKELLFTEDIFDKLKNKVFDIVEPQKAEFSGIAFPNSDFIPFCEFENAVKINLAGNEVFDKTDLSSEGTVSLGQEKEAKQEEKTVEERIDQKQEEKMGLLKEQSGEETVELPVVGKIETQKFSLPVLTFLIALADGFNPCAFFVLTFLLAALIGLSGARRKILLVGGIFVFFSGLFYFLFMSVLLNVFQLGEKVTFLTIIAGLIALFAGIINIKDYFYFQKGISLTLPKSHKEKFIQRVKNLSLAKSTLALIVGTAVIASTVNIYELLCTFGFPMVYARILTLRELSSLEYYLYLIFYNLVYVIPLAVIVLIFALTLGRKTFSQLWVRRLKLVSGFMILFLGLILMLKPKLLESALTAFSVLLLAIIISVIVILIGFIYNKRKVVYSKKEGGQIV
ncbi:hypothetical protein J7J12_02305 [bacterium]|nr:hypothetical protein [bacterium]